MLAPSATGGLSAGGGFDFQTRYAACHLPLWLRQGDFHQILFEGTGDIDIRLRTGSTSTRLHIQVKDHDVAPAELKTIVDQFVQTDSGMPGVYQQFTLACPSLSARLRPVETALARYRGIEPFYEDAPGALTPTVQEVDNRLGAAGLGQHLDFVRSKVLIDVGHGDLRHDDRALELFISRLLSHPDYAGKLRAMVQPAFSEVMRAMSARRGVVLGRDEIEAVLRAAVSAGGPEEAGVTIWIQNWTNESFDRTADYVLDWSAEFDRATRRVPPAEAWDTRLVPALVSLQKEIVIARKERLIRFRGKCALSTGVALGSAFPIVGGWVFEVPQPPSLHEWRSDAQPTDPYDLQVEVTDADGSGNALVLGLNIKGDGRDDVRRHVEMSGLRPKAYAFISPPSQGSHAIRGDGDACAFALAVRNVIGALLKSHRLNRTHLFFYGPLALAILLGQHLTSVGEVQLYEYQDPGYVASCKLRT